MSRPFPPGRVGLKTFLSAAGISKNTFYRRYRDDSHWISLLDIEGDRDHHLHFPHDAGEKFRQLRNKQPHGNRGRRPRRLCPACGAEAHPRHAVCAGCEHPLLPPRNSDSRASHSTAVRNGARRDALRRAKEQVALSAASVLHSAPDDAITTRPTAKSRPG